MFLKLSEDFIEDSDKTQVKYKKSETESQDHQKTNDLQKNIDHNKINSRSQNIKIKKNESNPKKNQKPMQQQNSLKSKIKKKNINKNKKNKGFNITVPDPDMGEKPFSKIKKNKPMYLTAEERFVPVPFKAKEIPPSTFLNLYEEIALKENKRNQQKQQKSI